MLGIEREVETPWEKELHEALRADIFGRKQYFRILHGCSKPAVFFFFPLLFLIDYTCILLEISVHINYFDCYRLRDVDKQGDNRNSQTMVCKP